MKQDIGLLGLRIMSGAAMLFGHGWSKLANFTAKSAVFPDPIGLGSSFSLTLTVFAEVFCAAAIIVGLFTRFASVPLFICMIVAGLAIHSADPFAVKEKALLYAAMYFALIFTGGGKFSIDHLMGKK